MLSVSLTFCRSNAYKIEVTKQVAKFIFKLEITTVSFVYKTNPIISRSNCLCCQFVLGAGVGFEPTYEVFASTGL